MVYNETSPRGEEVSLYWDDMNNAMNDETPAGNFFYNLIGGGFDATDERILRSQRNRQLSTAEGLWLERRWGKKLGIKRNGLNDDNYRKVLMAANYFTGTYYGIRKVLSLILGCEYEDILIIEEDTDLIRATDELHLEDYYDIVPDFLTDPEEINKFVTDRISNKVGSITVKYPTGLNTQIDDDTTLIDLIRPYISFVHVNYKEYVL